MHPFVSETIKIVKTIPGVLLLLYFSAIAESTQHHLLWGLTIAFSGLILSFPPHFLCWLYRFSILFVVTTNFADYQLMMSKGISDSIRFWRCAGSVVVWGVVYYFFYLPVHPYPCGTLTLIQGWVAGGQASEDNPRQLKRYKIVCWVVSQFVVGSFYWGIPLVDIVYFITGHEVVKAQGIVMACMLDLTMMMAGFGLIAHSLQELWWPGVQEQIQEWSQRCRERGPVQIALDQSREMGLVAGASVLWIVIWIFHILRYETTVGLERGLIPWPLLLALAAGKACSSTGEVFLMMKVVLEFAGLVGEGLRRVIIAEQTELGLNAFFCGILVMQCNPATVENLLERAIMVLLLLFFVGGFLSRTLADMVSSVLQKCVDEYDSTTRMQHLRVLGGGLSVISLCAFTVQQGFRMMQGAPGRTLLILVAGNDYLIAGVNVFAGLVGYVTSIWFKFRGRPLESADDLLLVIKFGAKGVQVVLMILYIGFTMIGPDSDVISMMGDISMFQMTLILLQTYGSIYIPVQAMLEELKGKRRVKAMHSMLREASTQEIDDLGDACPICLGDMETAVVTPCGHLYHATCLQRWLVTKNSCPKCSVKVLDEAL